MTKNPVNKYAYVMLKDMINDEIHTGKVKSITGHPSLRGYYGIEFESGVKYGVPIEKLEELVVVTAYEWPKGLFYGTVQFPRYRHTGLYFMDGFGQLNCFTYQDTKPRIVPGESIPGGDVALIDVIEEDVPYRKSLAVGGFTGSGFVGSVSPASVCCYDGYSLSV